MAKIATTELYTESDGWVEVDLYDPDDFPDSPIELYADGAWGTPALSTADTADLPFEIYTESSGWMGVTTTGYRVIEDFERGNLDSWVESQDVGIEVTSGRAAFQGNYGLNLGTRWCERIVSGPSFSNPLPTYPSPGDVWDSFIRFTDTRSFNDDVWHKYGCQTYPTSNGFDQDSTRNGYRVELARGDSLQFWKMDGYNDTLLDRTSVDFDVGQWYRLEIDWAHSTGGHIGRVFEVTKDDWVGNKIAEYGPVYHDGYGTGAISCAGFEGVQWDLLRRTAPV